MNFDHKNLLFGIVIIVISGCVNSADQQTTAYPTQLCEKAKYGQLDIGSVSISDSHINAYLLDCAVSVVVAEVSLQSGPHKGDQTTNINKQIIADYFLSQQLDLTYKNEDGNNVLMSIVISFLPDSWKQKAITNLINKGVDLKAKNNSGDTALDIAKFKGNQIIIEMLSY